MSESRIQQSGCGVYIRSADPDQHAFLLSLLTKARVPVAATPEDADLVLLATRGSSIAELDAHRRKTPNLPMALAGDDASPEMLEEAARSGAIAFLPTPSDSKRFSVSLQRAYAVAREINGLRLFATQVEDPENSDGDPAATADTARPQSENKSSDGPDRGPASSIAKKLTRAVDQEAFDLYYQPKVTVGARSIVGFEALIRWHDSEVGEISPVVFIPIAEELGLIERIGDWCIREACAQAARWSELDLPAGRISVNASPAQFQRSGFADRLLDTIRAAGIQPSQFELEITEGCLLESEEAIATLSALAESEVHIAVDDFGTGYSSLQYLRGLPIHCLKIDRVFITDLEFDSSARSLTAAIISLAWNLGLRIVAEGVETDFQWQFLADHGCDEIQGFHYSKALSPEDAERLLRREKLRSEHA